MDFVKTAGGGATVVAATYVNDTWAVGNNTTVTGNDSPASGSETASLKFGALGAFTVTLSGVNTIDTGAILVNSTVGANAATITGGTLTSGNANADGTHDLIVINNNSTASSSVVINSIIADNGANSVGLTAGSTLLTAPSGTIQLGAANTFSGATYITKGTLQLNNSLALQNSTLNYSLPGTLGFGSLTAATLGGLAGSYNLALPASFALTVGNNNANTIYSGSLSGAGATLTKVGGGTLTLNGANANTGNTTISTGTLALGASGVFGGSASLASSATLDVSAAGNYSLTKTVSGTGTVNGALTLAGGGQLNPSGTSGILTLSSNLTLNGGTCVINFDAGLNTNGTITIGAGGQGNLTLTSGTIQVNVTDGTLANGTYKIIEVPNGSIIGSGSVIAVSGFSQNGQAAAMVANAGALDLVVSPYISQNLLWTGDGSANLWNVNSAQNWNDLGPTAANPSVFKNDDYTTFDDTSAYQTVNLSGTLTPGSVTVTGTKSYTFTSTGKISGSTSLTNSSSGTLTILTTNDYVGQTVISSGIMQVGNGTTAGGAIGSGPVQDNAALVFDLPSGSQSIGAASGTGTLTTTGNGTLILNGADTLAGATTITTGTLRQGAPNVLPNGGGVGDMVINGTMDMGGQNGTINGLTGSGIIDSTVAGSPTLTVTGNGTFSGVIKNTTGSLALNMNGSGKQLTLSATNTYSGGTTITAGTLQLGNSNAISSGSLNVAASANLDLNGFGTVIDGLSGGGTIDSTAAGTMTLNIGNSGTGGTFSGAIKNTTGTVNLAKNGAGTEILTGNNSYSGNTIVYNGGLTITGGPLSSHLDLSAQLGVVNAVINGATVTSPSGLYITSPTGGSGTSIYGAAATLTITNGAQVTANADGNGRALSYGAGGNERPGGNGSLTVGTTGDTTTLVTVNGILDMFITSGGGTTGNFTVNLNGGTLAVNRIQESTYGSQSGTFQFNGGVLEALASDSTTPFIPSTPSQFTTPISTNGAIINPNSYNINIASLLTHGGGTPDGGLTLQGSGTLTVTNANQYTGGTIIKGGTLVINGIYALGGANYGGLTINGGTLQYSTNSTGNGSLDLTSIGTAGITLAAAGGAIDLNGNNVTYAGSVGNGGSGSLTLLTTLPGGVLNLLTNNTYLGNTLIGSGVILNVNNTNGSATGSGNVTVQSGGILDGSGIISGAVVIQNGGMLAGNGVIGGALEIQGGGILAPGNSVGTNTVGALTLDSGAICNFEFNGTANDRTVVTSPGGLTLNGGVFNLYLAGGNVPWATIGSYTLLQYTGTDPSLGSDWTTPSSANPHVGNPQASLLYSFTASGGKLTLTIGLSGNTVAGLWTNTATSGSWANAINWDSNPKVPHAAGDLATLGNGTSLTTVTLDGSKAIGSITFNNNNSYQITPGSGGTLTLDGNGAGATVYAIAGTANQIQTPVALNDNVTVGVSSSKSLAVSGNIANGTVGSKTLTVNSPGTLALSGNNSYGPGSGSYGTYLSGGAILQVGNNSALAAGDVSVTGNGTLQAGAAG